MIRLGNVRGLLPLVVGLWVGISQAQEAPAEGPAPGDSAAVTDFAGTESAHQQNAASDAAAVETIPVNAASVPDEAATASDGEAQRLAPVVVTGELIARDSERTPVSVSVHTGEEIARTAVRDIYDVIRSTPNASWHDNDLGAGSITLRGISSYGASMVQNLALYGTTTAVVFDGVALPRSAMAYSDLSAFDLDQVEIFRGPQSTSQGRNAMAGAVVINSVEPQVNGSLAPQFSGLLGNGNDGAWQGAAAAGMTLVPDVLGIRVVSDNRLMDGDLDNITLDDPQWAQDSNHGTRLRAKLTPWGEDGAYSALLGAGSIRHYNGNRYVEQPYESVRQATADERSFVRSDSKLYSLDQRLRLNGSWSLRAVSAYVKSQTFTHMDVDYGADPDGYIQVLQDARGFSQELRLSYEGEAVRGTVGAYYFNGDDGNDADGNVKLSALANAAQLCAVPGVCPLLTGNVLSTTSLPTHVEDMALFGEADWRATERLTLTAGLRLDHERNGVEVISKTAGDSVESGAIVALFKGAGVFGADGDVPVGRSFSAVLPKLAASYELTDGWFAGAAYTEGYRPGGDGYNYASGRRYSFDPEYTRNYELSLKGRWLPLGLRTSLNLFHTDWKDMQIIVGSGIDTYTANAGSARVDGGEFELSAALLDSLRMVAGVGITRGRFTDFVSAQGNYTGKPLPKAPRYNAGLALEWTPWESFLLRPEVTLEGPTSTQSDDAPAHQIGRYALLNLSARWQPGMLGLFFNGSNLTNRSYRTDAATNSLSGREVVALGYGRRVLAGIDLKF